MPTWSLATKFTSVGVVNVIHLVTTVRQVTNISLLVVNVADSVTVVTMVIKLLLLICCYGNVDASDKLRSSDISRPDCCRIAD